MILEVDNTKTLCTSDDYAPILIFCYRRSVLPLVESLKSNKEAEFSNLIIFSDGYKDDKDKKDVEEVRKELTLIDGFKDIVIFESKSNKGLASSIISGVSGVINEYGSVIVLEDDLRVSHYFLSYMNDSLKYYEKNRSIGSISAYSPNIEYVQSISYSVYFSMRPTSWGWGTWKNIWNSVEWNDNVIKSFDKKIRKEFERCGNDVYKMLELQSLGKIDSWAIKFTYFHFSNKLFTVAPKYSMVMNVGFSDGLGTHNNGGGEKWHVSLSEKKIIPSPVKIDEKLLVEYKNYYDISFYTRVGYLLKKYGGYKLAKKIVSAIRP